MLCNNEDGDWESKYNVKYVEINMQLNIVWHKTFGKLLLINCFAKRISYKNLGDITWGAFLLLEFCDVW